MYKEDFYRSNAANAMSMRLARYSVFPVLAKWLGSGWLILAISN
jgi:hypothetical protein